MGRPAIYLTEYEKRAAYLASKKRYREKQTFVYEMDPVSPRPPAEVLKERDLRLDLIAAMSAGDQMTSTPPSQYAAQYYIQAWRTQRRFARGQ